MISSFRTETMTLPKLVRKTSPTPMSQILGFLSNGINRQDAKAHIIWVSTRSVHNFWNTFVNAQQISLLNVPKLLEVRIIHQPSVFVLEAPEPPLVLIAAFLIISYSIDWNLTRRIFCKGPFSKIPWEDILTFGCFLISLESVSLFSGNTSFSILFVNTFMLNWCYLSPCIV